MKKFIGETLIFRYTNGGNKIGRGQLTDIYEHGVMIYIYNSEYNVKERRGKRYYIPHNKLFFETIND